MADPISAERLDELVDIDPLQLRDAAIALMAERDTARTEVDQLRAGLAYAYSRLRQATGSHAATVTAMVDDTVRQITGHNAERDRLAEQVKQLRNLTQDEDGNLLPPESELPVGAFYGVLYGEETSRG